jgi:hypothetical protein
MDEKSPLLNAVSTNSIEPGLLLPPVNPSSTEKSLYFHAYLSQLFAVFSRCFSKCAMVHCQSSYLILGKMIVGSIATWLCYAFAYYVSSIKIQMYLQDLQLELLPLEPVCSSTAGTTLLMKPSIGLIKEYHSPMESVRVNN